MIAEIFTSKRPWKKTLGAGMPLSPAFREKAGSEDARFTLVSEDFFRKVLSTERKRSERSRRRFVLMLVDVSKVLEGQRGEIILEEITEALSSSARETALSRRT